MGRAVLMVAGTERRRLFVPGLLLFLMSVSELAVCAQAALPSVITSKPAIRDHFKTGQRTSPRTEGWPE